MRRRIFLWFIIASLGLLGCRAKMSISSKHGPQAATEAPKTATPVEISDAFSSTRLYFQTRSTVTLQLKAPDSLAGSDLSLFNDSTNQSLIDHEPLSSEPAEGHAASLYADPAYDVQVIQIHLYPAMSAGSGAFAYGANKLRLLINDDDMPRFAQSTIYLHDFTHFGISSTSFADAVERQDGLEGDCNTLGSPSVSNGVATLSTGLVPILGQ